MSDGAIRALVAIGSNVGDPTATVLAAMDRLDSLSERSAARSGLWRSAPVDCPPGSAPFVNAAAAVWLSPEWTPERFLRVLHEIEAAFGRCRTGVRNEPRVLDLDLIAFGAEERSGPDLLLPHPRAWDRRFVLEPLREVAPDWRPPGAHESVAERLEGLAAREAGVEKVGSGGS